MLLDDAGNIIDLDAGIERAFGIDDHDRTERAETEAAGADDVDFLIKTDLGKLLSHLGNELFTVGRGTAGTAANQDILAEGLTLVFLSLLSRFTHRHMNVFTGLDRLQIGERLNLQSFHF